jgi:predicted small secreted protein
MKLAAFLLAASALVLSACATAPSAGAASANLQETASLMVSVSQHGEGSDAASIADLSAQVDAQVAAAPNDPFVLKLAAQSRTTLADYAADAAQKTSLRRQALAEFDKAISLSQSDTASHIVKINGQDTAVDLKDITDLRAQLAATITANQ